MRSASVSMVAVMTCVSGYSVQAGPLLMSNNPTHFLSTASLSKPYRPSYLIGESYMNKFAKYLLLAACAVGFQLTQSSTASAGCGPRQVYSSSMGQCVPIALGAGTRVFIPHGCPANLDRTCMRLPNGLLVNCRCVS